MRVRIENVVASSSFGVALDLPAIARSLEGAEYEPARFPGLIYRLSDPKTAMLLFHSGKVVCTGGKSWKQVETTLRIVADRIRQGGERIPLHPKIQVQNIVATSDLQCEVNLNSVAITLGLERVEYEPEQFPGLVCRLQDPRVVVLLFGSGRLVCTGARRPSDVQRAVQSIARELEDSELLHREHRSSASDRGHSSRAPGANRPHPVGPREVARPPVPA